VSNASSKSWKDEAIEKLGPVEIFFGTKYAKFIQSWRIPIILLGFVAAAYAGWWSKDIQGLSQMEMFFKEDHMLTVGFYKSLNGFNEGDQGQSIIVDIMWGIQGINKTGVDRFNAS
jgi:hypothetical protein